MKIKLNKQEVSQLAELSQQSGFKLLKEILSNEETDIRNKYAIIHSYEQIDKYGKKISYSADEQIQFKNGKIRAFRDILDLVENPQKFEERKK